MQLSRKHQELDEHGVGCCSVPMFDGYGMPAGFCDKPAYGMRPKCRTYLDNTGHTRRVDNLYDGYVPALACPVHGGPKSNPNNNAEVPS